MFTRVVECQAKKGKTEELTSRLRTQLLSTFQKQVGFVDLMALKDSKDHERIVCLSVWDTKDDSDHQQREHYATIVQMCGAVLATQPTVETLQVAISTEHGIVASRVA